MALKMRPATPGQSTQGFGWPRFVWFVKLNDSARNCTLIRSVTAKVLKNDMSSWAKCGPQRALRPTLPCTPLCGRCHAPLIAPFELNSALVLNQPNWLGSLACQLPTTSGRHQPESRSELQD